MAGEVVTFETVLKNHSQVIFVPTVLCKHGSLSTCEHCIKYNVVLRADVVALQTQLQDLVKRLYGSEFTTFDCEKWIQDIKTLLGCVEAKRP